MESEIKKYTNFFENLEHNTSIDEYGVFFDENSIFEDPFQKVKGLESIYNVFQNMYKQLHNPQFLVDEIICDKGVAYLRWRFSYSFSKNTEIQSFEGVSRVALGKNMKVLSHNDYWDAAFNIYEKFPILGFVIRFIKKRIHG